MLVTSPQIPEPALIYSQWHRTLGSSFFAMDLDWIEVRNHTPVALIETSELTPRHPTPTAVLSRFLAETQGFQFEVLFWVSQWLQIPAFVVCPHDRSPHPKALTVLWLNGGQQHTFSADRYRQFLAALPQCAPFFPAAPHPTATLPSLPIPTLLHQLRTLSHDHFRIYPYFRHTTQWLQDYQLRQRQIRHHTRWAPPARLPRVLPFHPVKTETTYHRSAAYAQFRRTLAPWPAFTVDWLEWRKESPHHLIGRPAACLRTQWLSPTPTTPLAHAAATAWTTFLHSPEAPWWDTLAQRLAIDWYFVGYTTVPSPQGPPVLGPRVYLWKNGEPLSHLLSLSQYRAFLQYL